MTFALIKTQVQGIQGQWTLGANTASTPHTETTRTQYCTHTIIRAAFAFGCDRLCGNHVRSPPMTEEHHLMLHVWANGRET